MKAKVLVISLVPIKGDSRVLRQIDWLLPDYQVSICGRNIPDFEGVVKYPVGNCEGGMAQPIRGALNLLFRGWRHRYFTPPIKEVLNRLKSENFDIVIANDLSALPLAIEVSKHCGAKVVWDAHEYSPDQNRGNFKRRIIHQLYVLPMCRELLPKVDAACTVSPGIQESYLQNYGLSTQLVLNSPPQFSTHTRPTLADHIKIIHHGFAMRARNLEILIDIAEKLPSRFTLDLMLVPYDQEYYSFLKARAGEVKNVSIIPPAAPHEILPKLCEYDLGIIVYEALTLNYKYCLPNKFFDFIQARLGVLVSDLPSMVEIVSKHQIGRLLRGSSAEEIAQEIQNISPSEIDVFKKNSDSCSGLYCSESQKLVFLSLIQKLVVGS